METHHFSICAYQTSGYYARQPPKKAEGEENMRFLKCLGAAALGVLLASGSALAQTTVKWLHLEVNPHR